MIKTTGLQGGTPLKRVDAGQVIITRAAGRAGSCKEKPESTFRKSALGGLSKPFS
jgi:hypothetical protein